MLGKTTAILPLSRIILHNRCTRKYSDIHLGNPTKEWLQQRAAVEHHAAESTDLWRKLSFYVAFPTTILTILWVRRVEADHAAHKAHIIDENGGEAPPVPDFDYLNKRAKPFPWGGNSLFFNPHTQRNMAEAVEE